MKESSSLSSSSALLSSSSARNPTLHHSTPEKIIVVGSSNQDLCSYSKVLPKLGQTVLGERFEISPGGKGANQAIAAARHYDKTNNVHIITRIGNDAFAKSIIQNFDNSNVKYDLETIRCENSHTGVAPILVDQKTGDNMIVVIPGANDMLSPKMVQHEMAKIKPQINNFRRAVILSQLEVPMESTFEAMKIGREWGATTILNPAPCNTDILHQNDGIGNSLLDYVDILIPNETELEQLVINDGKSTSTSSDTLTTEEDMAKNLLKNTKIRCAVIVTLGERGAMIVSRNNNNSDGKSKGGEDFQVTMVNAPLELECHNQPVVDTVGAGDCFVGSLAMYLSCGIELDEAATMACGVASISVRSAGAQTSYPLAEELPKVLRLNNIPSQSDGVPSNQTKRKILTFVTGNKKKLEEVQQILGGGKTKLPFEITNKKIDLPELQGDPVEIAIEKCNLAAKEINGPVFTEDTSLCFNALNGLPGPYIKWFLEKCGHDGLNNMLTGFQDKSAYVQTIVAFTWGPGEEVKIFDGRTHGSIVHPRGALDFGWDPIFEPNESDGKTYAEMKKEEKNIISHRGKSFQKFQSFLYSCETE